MAVIPPFSLRHEGRTYAKRELTAVSVSMAPQVVRTSVSGTESKESEAFRRDNPRRDHIDDGHKGDDA
jgi:hypothetical protein